MQCEMTKRNTLRCRAQALRGKKYCNLHSDPGKAAELGSKGGSKAKNNFPLLAEREAEELANVAKTEAEKQAILAKTAPLVTIEQVRALLSESLALARAGKLSPRKANSLAFTAHTLLRAMAASGQHRRNERIRSELTLTQTPPIEHYAELEIIEDEWSS